MTSRLVPKLNRRSLLAGSLAMAAAGMATSLPAYAAAGSIDPTDFGIRPDTSDDQSRAFARMLDEASARNAAILLPPGRYVLSDLTLPHRTHLSGVPGASHIVYGGGRHLFAAEDAALVDLSGLTFDGVNLPLDDASEALIHMRRVDEFVMDRCEVRNSSKSAVALERVSGRLERSTLSGAADCGLYCVEGSGMRVASNAVADCGNGGILVHRWEAEADGAIVTGNRVERIGAQSGGTGQNGNVFRADNVIVANNHVADCAFSAIRANSAGNVQITGNQCLRSGETAIYSEFSFEGAVIASNIVDGAAMGISIANLDEGGRMAVCNGNIVRNLVDEAPYEDHARGFGIGICAEADTAITGNVVEGAPRHGMMLGWGPFLRNVVATGNVVRKSGDAFAVSVVEGAGSVLVADNIIEDARRAIVGYRWGDAATGDLAGSNDSGYPHLVVERNRVS